MRKYKIVFLIVFIGLSTALFAALYQGKNIDEKHFSAEIQKEDTTNVYKVDVVFVGKAANLRFAVDQVLPVEANNNFLMTLYLEEEEIEDPEKVILKQVKPPLLMDDSKPEDWEAEAFWHLKLDLSSLN